MPPTKHHRHPRLRDRDYRHGAYFITLCTLHRAHHFGTIVGIGNEARLAPSPIGALVQDEWQGLPAHFPHLRLDEFQLMPDHLHAIVILDREALVPADDEAALRAGPTTNNKTQRGTLGTIIAAFKGAVTFKLNKLHHTTGQRYWQPGY